MRARIEFAIVGAMKSFTLLMGILLILIGSPQIRANDCFRIAQPSIQAGVLNALPELDQYFEGGFCGVNITIGLLVDAIPQFGNTEAIFNAQKLVFTPVQEAIWRSRSKGDARVSTLIETLNAVAPNVKIAVFQVSITPDIDMVSVFGDALAFLREQNAAVIVNVSSHFLTANESEQLQITGLLNTTLSEGIVWIQSAGSFGNGYYSTSEFRPSALRNIHNFAEMDGIDSLLQVEPLAENIAWGAVVIGNGPPDVLRVRLCTSNEPTTGNCSIENVKQEDINRSIWTVYAPQVDGAYVRRYISVERTTTRVSLEDQGFRIFIGSATLPQFPMNEGSIPFPNALPGTWTVGALPAPPDSIYAPLSASRFTTAEGQKPEIYATGIVSNDPDNYTSGIAPILTAGSLALLLERDGNLTPESAMNILADNRGVANELRLPIPRTPIEAALDESVPLVNIIVIGSVVIALSVSSYIYWRWRADLLKGLENMPYQIVWKPNERALAFEFRPPWNQNGRLKATFIRSLTVDVTFSPQLANANYVTVEPSFILKGHTTRSRSTSFQPLQFLGFGRGIEINHPALSEDRKNLPKTMKLVLQPKSFNSVKDLPTADQYFGWSLSNIYWEPISAEALVIVEMHYRDELIIRHHRTLAGVVSPENSETTPVKMVIHSQASKEMQIFVSYSRKDKDFVYEFVEFFKLKHIFNIWIDREDIPIGSPFLRDIEKGLSASAVMLLILSPDAVDSDYVDAEWQYFVERQETKRIIPLIYRPCKVPELLAKLNYQEYNSRRRKDIQHQLLRALIAYREDWLAG